MLPMLISAAFATSMFLVVLLLGNWRSSSVAAGADIADRLTGFRDGESARRRFEAPPDPDASFSERVLRPLTRKITRRINDLLPTTFEERIQASISHAGLRMSSSQFILIIVICGGVIPIILAGLLFTSGSDVRTVLLTWLIMSAVGAYGPRLWLGNKVKKRQKAIWRQLPDAFDLVTASVEAGLGIDAALSRVVEKTTGPFTDELRATLREISMGRSRRDALQNLGDRTGVEDLQSFLNAIIQAETMGVSIGNVIRVQTGVLRTRRRQKAEEQAFKAPIKMVFPLVFFIFPSLMIVIGGPAFVQLRDGVFA